MRKSKEEKRKRNNVENNVDKNKIILYLISLTLFNSTGFFLLSILLYVAVFFFFFYFRVCLLVFVCFMRGWEVVVVRYIFLSVRCEFIKKERHPLVVALCVTMQAKATDNVLIFTNSCIFIFLSLPHSYYLQFAHWRFHLLILSLTLLLQHLPWLIPQKYKYKNCAVKAQPQSNLDIDFFLLYFHSDLFIFTHQHIPVADGIETQNVECFQTTTTTKSSCFAENSEKFYLYE